MTTAWLVVFVFLNGTWVLGDTLDGWGARPYDSFALCEEHRVPAQERNDEDQTRELDVPKLFWMCVTKEQYENVATMPRPEDSGA